MNSLTVGHAQSVEDSSLTSTKDGVLIRVLKKEEDLYQQSVQFLTPEGSDD